MFTGIIEETGTIVSVQEHGDDARLLTIRGSVVLSDAAHGDSIAVSGVCLTVVDLADGTFTADVMKQTLDHTSLGAKRPGDTVNLERAARVDSRLGGHIVQGHVDGVGTVVAVSPSEHWTVVAIAPPAHLLRYLVAQGSVTVDGVSLTVASIDDGAGEFTVSLIPTTLAATTLGSLDIGDHVNLEVDVLAKYVERLLPPRARPNPARRTAVSGAGAPTFDLTGLEGVRVAIVASSWHDTIMDSLVANALATCAEAGADATVVRVPGSFELGLAALKAARAGYDAVVALGVIIRGGTPHFEYVSSATTDALNRVSLDTGVPVGFGVLTCDDEAQALARAGLPHSAENKGREAAEAALVMVSTLRSLGW